MSDGAESVEKQTLFTNLEGVHFTINKSQRSLHKISSTPTLKKHQHLSSKGSTFNELAFFVQPTPSRPNFHLESLTPRASIRSSIRNPSLKSIRLSSHSQPRFEQSTLQPKYLRTMKFDHEYWTMPIRNFHDDADILSKQPSYTIKNVSYSLECHQRYKKARAKYNAQLRREMEKYVSLKPRVADQYSTRCFLRYSTLWPPLHTKRELEIFNRHFLKLNAAEQKRLNFIMTAEFSYA